jgi:hypothetical protein
MSALSTTADSPPDLDGFAPARAATERYGDALLRRCAAQFGRQRVNSEPSENREHIVSAIENPVLIDRTLKSLSPAARRLLRLAGIGVTTRWQVQSLVDLGSLLGTNDGIAPVREWLEAGLAFPELPPRGNKLQSWDDWLGGVSAAPLVVHIAPLALSRSARETLELPQVDFDVLPAAPLEADGLEWPLRVAVAWQVVRDGPLRLTQQNGLFKRDLDRIQGHSLLSAPPAELVGNVPDAGLLAVVLAQSIGLLDRDADQIVAASSTVIWPDDLGAILGSLWSAVVSLTGWDAQNGWTGGPQNTLAALAVTSLAILAKLPEDQWAVAADLDALLTGGPDAHPGQVAAFWLGLGHQLRLVQAAKHKDRWWIRATALGRSIAAGQDFQLPPPAIEQTLVVQPNLEIVVYRQGLTPALISRLSRVADWKSLGLACTLGLTAESVYHGLEAGESLSELIGLFNRHGTRPLSDTVLNSLRSWASKRDRVLAFPSALVLEFRSAEELEQAVRLGLVQHRLTDRLGLIGSEADIDYEQFRLIGSRDYLAADELCIDVANDGLTLSVNEHKSDLLLESELLRFAERAEGRDGEPAFRLTVNSLRSARDNGLDESGLDGWFRRRAGRSLPAAAHLLMTADQTPPFEMVRRLLLHVPTEELADGLAAWPESASLLGERLAPAVFAVSEEFAGRLRRVLEQIGIRCEFTSNGLVAGL